MNQSPQRRPYVARTSSFAGGTDSPVRVLDECLGEIDRREEAVGAFTVIDCVAARSAAEASAARWRAGKPLSTIDGMPVGAAAGASILYLPTTATGRIALSAAQLTALLDGCEWRASIPRRRPELAG